MSVSDLPALNASLNALSAILLTAGFIFIKRGEKTAHRNCMIAAFVVSAIFLVSYLTYHAQVGHTSFQEPAWFRPIYLAILIPHVLLAGLIVPMILAALWFAFRGTFEKHRRIARWTWPLWMFVSITGVIIYLLLYQIFPQS